MLCIVFTKAMCSHCQGIGKLELYNEKGHPNNSKFCEKCKGTGKRPYTLHEKITIANLKLSKSGYSERYEPYELIAEGCIENWENSIRNCLARSFHFESEAILPA